MNDSKQNGQTLQLELTVSAWQTALDQLVAQSGLGESQILDAATKGAVWRRKQGMHKLRRLRDFHQDIGIGDVLFLNYDPTVLSQNPLTPELVSDEKNYSIWKKPAGMLSQGSKWSDHSTITETVKRLHNKPTYLVHRLDKAASGLMVLAHTKNAVKTLSKLFADRQIDKYYRVVVHGQCSLDLPAVLDAPVEDKPAVTHILECEYDEGNNTSEMLVSILTGRKHQIRSHLFGAGFPVVGDRLFDKDRQHATDLQLSASRLEFVCPFTSVKKVFTV